MSLHPAVGATDGTTPAAAAPPEHRWRTRTVESRAAGALCAVAGLVHVVVVPEHAAEWAPAGVFLVVVATFQLWLGQALWRGTAARVLPAAVVATAGLVALYVASRTVGLPFRAEGSSAVGGHHGALTVPGGHGNGMPIIPGAEPDVAPAAVGLLDVVCVAAEFGALALLVGLLPVAQRRSVTNLLLAVGICGWLVWAAVRFT